VGWEEREVDSLDGLRDWRFQPLGQRSLLLWVQFRTIQLMEQIMARHFGPQHMKNNYAAMGNNTIGKPNYAYGGRRNRSVAEAIQAERAAAARAAAIKRK
jgi:hypothetical protein